MNGDTHALEQWLVGEEKSNPPPRTVFVGLSPLSQSLILYRLAEGSSEGALLAIFSSKAEARAIFDNLCFFSDSERQKKLHYIPSLDFDFYRGVLPNAESIIERNVALLHALGDPAGRIFVTTAAALAQKAIPVQTFIDGRIDLRAEDEVDRDALVARLSAAGYQRQPAAMDPGVFAVRGSVIDVYSPVEKLPLRIEFFGDGIESIRTFDPASQRSIDSRERVSIGPVGMALKPEDLPIESVAAKLKDRLDAIGIPRVQRDEVIAKLREASNLPEYPFLFSLVSGGSSSIFDYFDGTTRWVWGGRGKIVQTLEQDELPRLAQNHELFEKQPAPIAAAEDLFTAPDDFKRRLKDGYAFEDFESAEAGVRFWKLENSPVEPFVPNATPARKNHPLPLERFVASYRAWLDEGYRIHLVCHSQLHAERARMLLEPYGIRFESHAENSPVIPAIFRAATPPVHAWIGNITESQRYSSLRTLLLSEEQIFGHKKRAARSAAWRGSGDPDRRISTFRDLQAGDFVVHRDHGIGKYLGLKFMTFQGVANDYVLLEYRDGDKLYVPVYRLNVLQKYIGGEGAGATLDKLGADRWSKAKSKAQLAVAELAAEFLKIQAQRKLIPAPAFSTPGPEFHEFEMAFPFDETPDQAKAIEDVMADLSLPHPMDRLVCGDVGYGKTEVALRAAYRAVLDRMQVAVLVPTTVLCFQHFENFKRRLSGTGATVEMISRLRSNTQIKAILEKLRDGKVDIVIGTHRILSTDVLFKSLGLMVVDEEHRFGVVHKDRLKKIARSVHVLSLTATPIPRTLNMAMTGIKELSVISTPPPDRLAVRTFVCRDAPEVVGEAISNELARGGQVFFVHNRIEAIVERAAELQALFPKVTFEIVHGQMSAEELESKMLRFYRAEAQVLVTTAIIESGLDIPQANTILIDRADCFGLAQLYQLRGRVGRSERRAYCYLLIPGENQITEDARERLQVIQRYTDLGSGFHIASHDLEIRGAGDLLGKEQSGHFNAIGIDLYFELLEESIRALRGEVQRVEIEPEINLRVPASFPDDYLPDISERIQLYRRLSGADTDEMISEIEEEIRDRFGPLPVEVINLLGLMQIKLHLKRLHVVKMSCGPKRTSLQFAPTTPARPEKLVQLVQSDPQTYAITPDQKLVFSVGETDWRAQLSEVQRLAAILCSD